MVRVASVRVAQGPEVSSSLTDVRDEPAEHPPGVDDVTPVASPLLDIGSRQGPVGATCQVFGSRVQVSFQDFQRIGSQTTSYGDLRNMFGQLMVLAQHVERGPGGYLPLWQRACAANKTVDPAVWLLLTEIVMQCRDI